MSGQNSILNRTTSATWQAIRGFMVGTDGIAGAALIEFAIIAPLLTVMCVYVTDFGLFFVRQTELQHATQAGALYAMEHGYNSAAISSAVTNDANDPTFTISAAAGYPLEFCGCPSSKGVTQLTTGACAQGTTCSGGAVAGTYVTVSTTATYTPVAPVSGGIFSTTILSSYTLKGLATVRIQ